MQFGLIVSFSLFKEAQEDIQRSLESESEVEVGQTVQTWSPMLRHGTSCDYIRCNLHTCIHIGVGMKDFTSF